MAVLFTFAFTYPRSNTLPLYKDYSERERERISCPIFSKKVMALSRSKCHLVDHSCVYYLEGRALPSNLQIKHWHIFVHPARTRPLLHASFQWD
jgi:hypothetical protein